MFTFERELVQSFEAASFLCCCRCTQPSLELEKTGKMTTYRPTQIYASIASQTRAAQSPVKNQQKTEETGLKFVPTKSNEIQVSATGELSLTPDRCRLTINMSSTKDLVQEVKNSVSRRLDYILQTLHNYQVKVNINYINYISS